MAVDDPIKTTNKLKLFVHAGPRFGGKGEVLNVEWVVARRPVDSERGWGLSLGDAIEDLFRRERGEGDTDDDLM